MSDIQKPKHSDHATMVPIRFTFALRQGKVDCLQYALGCLIATACYEARNTTKGCAVVRMNELVELLEAKPEKIRRRLHGLAPEWLQFKVNQGRGGWTFRLTGLASPPQDPLELLTSSSNQGAAQRKSLSTERNSAPSANGDGYAGEPTPQLPPSGDSGTYTRPDPTRYDPTRFDPQRIEPKRTER
jgi:hypothetical protein